MHSSPFFSLPLYQSSQPPSVRASAHQSKKRKHRSSGLAGSSNHDVTNTNEAPCVVPGLTLEHQPTEEDTDVPLPSFFPHQPLVVDRGPHANARRADLDLTSPLVPRAWWSDVASAGMRLRLRHLSTLTTLLHRCLLDGDFVRAGRAWGMILRSELPSRRIDLRAEGRWGLGAEILLRQKDQRRGDGDGNPNHDATALFTINGFARAKEYYERLILQYPFNKHRPDVPSVLDFYPAMFGLWIWSTQEEQNARLSWMLEDHEHRALTNGNEMSHHDLSESCRLCFHLGEQLRQFQLAQAEQMAARIDELMLSPPYSDSPQIWKLRGMISLWLGDLSEPAGMDAHFEATSEGARRHQHQQDIEHHKAHTAFQKALRAGGIGTAGIPSSMLRQVEDEDE